MFQTTPTKIKVVFREAFNFGFHSDGKYNISSSDIGAACNQTNVVVTSSACSSWDVNLQKR